MPRYSLFAIRYSLPLIAAMLFWFNAAPVFAQGVTQQDYRWYANTDAQTPTDPWPSGGSDLAEDSAITASDGPPQSGDVLRVRVNLHVSGFNMDQGSFSFQYATGTVCSSIPTWTFIDAAGGSGVWRLYDNASVTDGSTLSDLLLSSSNVRENYIESVPRDIANVINDGQTGEWDFVIQDNAAPAGTSYCFRMVSADGTAMDSYTNYPTLVTKMPVYKSQDWIWYGDETNETPSDTLAATNTRPIGVRNNDPIKLRVTLKETEGTSSPNQKYRLRYATSTDFSNAANVVESGSCLTTDAWCYADGVDADDAVISTILLADAGTAGRHNETGTGASTFTHPANAAVEMEFTIQPIAPEAETLYYFQVYDQTHTTSVAPNAGETNPYLQTFGPVLEFAVAGLSSGTVVDNYTTNVTTTATTIPFGVLVPNQTYDAAQRLTVSTDGISYTISIRYNDQMRTITGETIEDFTGSNEVPEPWDFFPTEALRGALAYHTSDDILSQGSTRFQADDTWAALTTTDREIVYTEGPVENDVHDILYRIYASAIQPAGDYSTTITYVAVAGY